MREPLITYWNIQAGQAIGTKQNKFQISMLDWSINHENIVHLFCTPVSNALHKSSFYISTLISCCTFSLVWDRERHCTWKYSDNKVDEIIYKVYYLNYCVSLRVGTGTSHVLQSTYSSYININYKTFQVHFIGYKVLKGGIKYSQYVGYDGKKSSQST